MEDCRIHNGIRPSKRLVSPWMRSNVCFLKPTTMSTTCDHAQGVLGGGATVAGGVSGVGTPHTNLYTYALAPSAATREKGGLFVQPQRDIFRKLAFTATDVGIDKNFLHLSRGDIGGHQLHFVVTKTGVMQIHDIVLGGGFGQNGADAVHRKNDLLGFKRPTTDGVPTDGTELRKWMAWDIEAEHRDAMQQEPDLLMDGRPIHWACPLKQRLYLSGQAGTHFRPSLPNQRRASSIFKLHNVQNDDASNSVNFNAYLNSYLNSTLNSTLDSTIGNFPEASRKRVNTMQAAGAASAFLLSSAIKTSNGFCFCDNSDDCRIPISSTSDCGILHNFDMLRTGGAKWHTSKILKGQSTKICKQQLDWPYTGGVLRDGSTIGASTSPGGGLGPQPPLARHVDCNILDRMHDFQYMYTKTAINTEDVHRNTQVSGGDCYTGKAKHSEPSTETAKPRFRWNPTERRSCAHSCAAPPVFTAGPNHTQIPAETSFGVLYRASAEHAIAANLRERLYKSLCYSGTDDTTCDELDLVLNVSSWVPAKFWPAFLEDVTSLFTSRSDWVHADRSIPSENNTNATNSESRFALFNLALH